jgi:hypothetical protein
MYGDIGFAFKGYLFAVHGKVLFLPQFYFGFAEFHEIDDPSPMLLFEANEKCSEKGKENLYFGQKPLTFWGADKQ